MIRAVFDTNIVISGMLWGKTPGFLFQGVAEGLATLFVSEMLLDELKDVLERPKFAKHLNSLGKSAAQIVEDYAGFTEIIEPDRIEPVVIDDPDDDHILACAVSAQVDYIVSGDNHLLDLKHYRNIPILTANEFLTLLDNEFDKRSPE